MTTIIIKNIPDTLSNKLLGEYLQIKKHFSMHDWGPGQLNGGRFAEVVLRIFQSLLGEQVTAFGTDIPGPKKTTILNAVQNHPHIDEHIRQKVVSLVRLLLDFRNNRDSAHLGGFDASAMDTIFVMTVATWISCEFLRAYGGYPMDQAQRMVDGLSVKEYPVLMEFEGELFLTKPDLKASYEVLIILYRISKADFDLLFSKVRDSNKSRFRSTLNNMLLSKLIGKKDDSYFLMPRGIKEVEDKKLLHF